MILFPGSQLPRAPRAPTGTGGAPVPRASGIVSQGEAECARPLGELLSKRVIAVPRQSLS